MAAKNGGKTYCVATSCLAMAISCQVILPLLTDFKAVVSHLITNLAKKIPVISFRGVFVVVYHSVSLAGVFIVAKVRSSP